MRIYDASGGIRLTHQRHTALWLPPLSCFISYSRVDRRLARSAARWKGMCPAALRAAPGTRMDARPIKPYSAMKTSWCPVTSAGAHPKDWRPPSS